MYEPLQDPAAIETLHRFFNDLIAVAGVGAPWPLLRPEVENFREEALNYAGMPRTQDKLRGFLCGLKVTGALTPEQAREFTQRVNAGRQDGWL
ncbi:hypothetical protein [Pseudomonas sp. R1-15]|uniref:hypothetical protein n=1 Tax=Pseudomonas sp. R1-15 TaxID=2817399 RepID=UPI003DA9C504